MSKEKILMTGTAGFIGFHAANKFLESGYEVIGLDNINDYYDVKLKYGRLADAGIQKEEIYNRKLVKSIKHKAYSFIKMDLEDKEGLAGLFSSEKFDYVVHLAAQAGVRHSLKDPDTYISSNIVGFLNILEGCRKNSIKHLIFASSSSVYGLSSSTPMSSEDKTDRPISLYAATKKSNELMAYSYSHLYDIPATGLRFFTVYGPWNRPDMALHLFTEAILNGTPIKLFNNGNLKRDFTYIDDIVDGIHAVLDCIPDHSQNAPFQLYNIGNGKPVELLQFIGTIEKHIGKKAIIKLLPMQPGDVEVTYADCEPLEDAIGFRPGTDINVGVQKYVEWYKNYHGAQGFC